MWPIGKHLRQHSRFRILLAWHVKGVAIVLIDDAKDVPIYFPRLVGEADLPKALRQLVCDYRCAGAKVHIILAPDYYRTYTLDAPNVPEAELADSARWLLKDLVRTPLSELAVDAFLLPSETAKQRMCVVAGSLEVLSNMQRSIATAKLALAEVTVAEMSLCRYFPARITVAVLSASAEGYRFFVVNRGELIFLRELHVEIPKGPSDLADFSLELQRTLDAYQRQHAKQKVYRLYILPDLAESLSGVASLMSINVETLPVQAPKGMQQYADQLALLQGYVHALPSEGRAQGERDAKN